MIIECSGAAPAVQDGFPVAAPAARIVLVGMGAATMELPVATIQIKELQVTGTFRTPTATRRRSPWPPPVRWTWTGWSRPRFGLAEVADALQAAKRDPATLKPMVYPGPADPGAAARPGPGDADGRRRRC